MSDSYVWKHVPTGTYLSVMPSGNKVLSKDPANFVYFNEENFGVAVLARSLQSVNAKFSDFEAREVSLP